MNPAFWNFMLWHTKKNLKKWKYISFHLGYDNKINFGTPHKIEFQIFQFIKMLRTVFEIEFRDIAYVKVDVIEFHEINIIHHL